MRYRLYALLLLLLAGGAGCKKITVTAATDRVPRYGIFELTVEPKQAAYNNPWEDVSLALRLTDSAGHTVTVDGFYYRGNQWKARFSPTTPGVWRWTLSFTAAQKTWQTSGHFTCEPSEQPGFVRRHSSNPFRLVFDNGALFNALGIGDCILDINGDGTPLDDWGLDGGFRPPPDPRTGTHDLGKLVDMTTYMKAYGAEGAGFNLFRWSVDNCAFKLWDTIAPGGNRYRVPEGVWGDELVAALRQHGFRLWLTFFNRPPFLQAEQNPAEREAIQRYMRYVIARYGAYADVWELMNEVAATEVSPAWIAFATDYLHAIDPYRHLISTSDERADLPGIDLDAPHWFERESELESDLRTAQEIEKGKAFGKPVVFAEQSNQFQNWDARSGLRMRLRSWTAFFEEGVLIFWNSSFAKDLLSEGSANLYIGPEERRYVRVLQNFTARVPADIQRFTPALGDDGVRAYGLRSSRLVLGYFHHFRDHENPVHAQVTLDLPADGTATWINPADGAALQSLPVKRGPQTLTTPDFIVDLALKIQM